MKADSATLDKVKESVWNQLASASRLPGKLATKQHQLKTWAWNDDEFWSDLLDRHGLRHVALDRLDPYTREHAVGNFHGMLIQIACEHGVKL